MQHTETLTGLTLHQGVYFLILRKKEMTVIWMTINRELGTCQDPFSSKSHSASLPFSNTLDIFQAFVYDIFFLLFAEKMSTRSLRPNSNAFFLWNLSFLCSSFNCYHNKFLQMQPLKKKKKHLVLLVRNPVQWGLAGFSAESLRMLKSGCQWGCVPFWRLWG